jgi:hypothetical protein
MNYLYKLFMSIQINLEKLCFGFIIIFVYIAICIVNGCKR